jgi:ribose transport system permease protein
MTAWRFWRTREFGTALVLAAMILACEIASRAHTGTSFILSDRLGRVLSECAYVGIAAIGACVVILSGGVDLSSGSVMGLSGVALGYAYARLGWPAPAALLLGLASGLAVGLLNGVLVGKLRIPPFIATLGFLSIARGAGYWLTRGITIPLEWREAPSPFFAALGEHAGKVMLALAVAAAAVLARFRWGRYVYAVGGNEEAARFAGLPVARIKVGVYAVGGLLAALAGCAYALHYAQAHVSNGRGYELQIIAACAIGGVRFSGGQGSVVGAVLGAAALRVLYTLLLQFQVKGEYIEIAYGAAIILAVAVDQWGRGLSLPRRWFGRARS